MADVEISGDKINSIINPSAIISEIVSFAFILPPYGKSVEAFN
tara:strand:- start:1080 stop:1208 length:129 start_codon:yes stop_codon:yes gene_type:complete